MEAKAYKQDKSNFLKGKLRIDKPCEINDLNAIY